MVLKPGKEPMAEAIFRKWELDFAVIGEVTDTGRMVLEFDGEVVCDIPLGPLADDAPLYDRPYLSREEYKAWAKVFNDDATLASAVLDRLLHHNETILIEGRSFRMKDQIEPPT